MPMLLTSDVPSHDLPGLNVPYKPFSNHILDEDSGLVYDEHEQTLTYMLESKQVEFYRKKEEFHWAQRDFVTYMKEDKYWLKMELIGFMLSIVFAIHLCFCHRKVFCTGLMALDKILQDYKTAVVHICTTPGNTCVHCHHYHPTQKKKD